MSLRERRDIVQMAAGAVGGVLVTLVRAAGSSYRQPGARLLALPDGRTAGTISGGCLEADLLRKAEWRVREGAAMQRYDTSFDDDAEVPFGLGCGGVVDLLLEPRDAPEADALLDAFAATLRGEPRAVVTQLPGAGQAFGRVVIDARGDVLFASDVLETERVVALRAMTRDRTRNGSARPGVESTVFVEAMPTAQRLLVCGAGEDAKPVVRMAAELGWRVAVVDGRPQQARAERFPLADSVEVLTELRPLLPQPDDAVVVLTHSYEQDLRFVTELLGCTPEQQPRYVGLLGARHRSALLLQQAAKVNGISLDEALRRVHAPIGLDLGGEGPESIALAVIAEVQQALAVAEGARSVAARNAVGGGSRRMSAGEASGVLERLRETGIDSARCALDVWPTPAPEAERRRLSPVDSSGDGAGAPDGGTGPAGSIAEADGPARAALLDLEVTG